MFGCITEKHVAPTELNLDTIINLYSTNMPPRWGYYIISIETPRLSEGYRACLPPEAPL